MVRGTLLAGRVLACKPIPFCRRIAGDAKPLQNPILRSDSTFGANTKEAPSLSRLRITHKFRIANDDSVARTVGWVEARNPSCALTTVEEPARFGSVWADR